MKTSIPLWVIIVASLMTLSSLAFSIHLAISPKTFFPDTDFSAKGVRHFTNMWAMRQFTLGALQAYCLIKQNAQILKITLILMFSINVLTIVEGILINQIDLIIESIIYCGLSAVMLLAINKKGEKLAL